MSVVIFFDTAGPDPTEEELRAAIAIRRAEDAEIAELLARIGLEEVLDAG